MQRLEGKCSTKSKEATVAGRRGSWGKVKEMRSGTRKQGVHGEGANHECPIGQYKNLSSYCE